MIGSNPLMQMSLYSRHVPFEFMDLEGDIRVEQDIPSTTRVMTDSYAKNKFYLFFLLYHTVL